MTTCLHKCSDKAQENTTSNKSTKTYTRRFVEDNDNSTNGVSSNANKEIDVSKLLFNFDDIPFTRSTNNNNQILNDHIKFHSNVISSAKNYTGIASNLIKCNSIQEMASKGYRRDLHQPHVRICRKISDIPQRTQLSYSEATQRGGTHQTATPSSWRIPSQMFSPYIIQKHNLNGMDNTVKIGTSDVEEQQAFARLSAKICSSETPQGVFESYITKLQNYSVEPKTRISPDLIRRPAGQSSSSITLVTDNVVRLSTSSTSLEISQKTGMPLTAAIPKTSVLYQCLKGLKASQSTNSLISTINIQSCSPALKINLQDMKDSRKNASDNSIFSLGSVSLVSIPKTSVLHQIYKGTKSNVALNQVSSCAEENPYRLTSNIYEGVKNFCSIKEKVSCTSFNINKQSSSEYTTKSCADCIKRSENEIWAHTDALQKNAANPCQNLRPSTYQSFCSKEDTITGDYPRQSSSVCSLNNEQTDDLPEKTQSVRRDYAMCDAESYAIKPPIMLLDEYNNDCSDLSSISQLIENNISTEHSRYDTFPNPSQIQESVMSTTVKFLCPNINTIFQKPEHGLVMCESCKLCEKIRRNNPNLNFTEVKMRNRRNQEFGYATNTELETCSFCSRALC